MIDLPLLDEIFEMGGGYVLNFSDRTFAQFFAEELNIDICDPRYLQQGTSKAKRLRCFLQTVDKTTAVKVLKALWNYRKLLLENARKADTIPNAEGRFNGLLNRIQAGSGLSDQVGRVPPPAFDRHQLKELQAELLLVSQMEPHQRGFAFEKFLKKFFNLHGLEARDAFRLSGEQIDGSFQLGNETYLLEAKWQSAPVGVGDLHTFHGKIEQKAAWARGLFISNSGFSDEGLNAFGRGKRVICVDGLDIYEILQRELPLNTVLERKIRRAAETGLPFVRVRDLF